RWCRCGMICCLLVARPALGAQNYDGTYTGKRVVTKGDCLTEDYVTVTIKGAVLTFTNSAISKFAIGINPRPDGSFGLIHADIGGAVVSIRGRIVGNALDADVINGACEHHWHVEKP